MVRTAPDSSIVNPAHIHITSAPQTRNAKVLRMNWVSSSTPDARAMDGRAKMSPAVRIPAPSVTATRLRFASKFIGPRTLSGCRSTENSLD